MSGGNGPTLDFTLAIAKAHGDLARNAALAQAGKISDFISETIAVPRNPTPAELQNYPVITGSRLDTAGNRITLTWNTATSAWVERNVTPGAGRLSATSVAAIPATAGLYLITGSNANAGQVWQRPADTSQPPVRRPELEAASQTAVYGRTAQFAALADLLASTDTTTVQSCGGLGGGLFTLLPTTDPATADRVMYFARADGRILKRRHSGRRTLDMAVDVVGDGVADDSAAFEAAINAQPSMDIPDGYVLRLTRSITCPPRLKLRGAQDCLIWDGPDGQDVFLLKGNSRAYGLQGVTRTRDQSSYLFNVTGHYGNIKLYDNDLPNGLKLVQAKSSKDAYADVTDANSPYGIEEWDNTLYVNPGARPSGAAILMLYTNNWTSRGGSVDGYDHGVQGWGGDSNTVVDGAVANARKCYRGRIQGKLVQNCANGGIWGSMMRNVVAFGNIIDSCGDVGLDFEGCVDTFGTANHITNCQNGGMSTFYASKNVTFMGNTVIVNNGTPAFRIYNVTQDGTLNRGVRLLNNTITSYGFISSVDADYGPAQDVFAAGNILTNVVIRLEANNLSKLIIKRNELDFDLPLPGGVTAAIRLSGYHNNARVELGQNSVRSSVAQPAGSYAYSLNHDDFISSATTLIVGNSSMGFPADYYLRSGSGNFQTQRMTFKDNVLDTGIVTRVEEVNGGASDAPISSFAASGNQMTDGTPWPRSRDDLSIASVGTRRQFSAPDADGYTAEMVTVGGRTPTWKRYGKIEA